MADTILLLRTLLYLRCSYLILLLSRTDQWAVYRYRQDLSCNRQRQFGIGGTSVTLLVHVVVMALRGLVDRVWSVHTSGNVWH